MEQSGTLEGTVPGWLDPEDEADAEFVLVDSQPPHPQQSDAWGSRTGEPSMFRLTDDCWTIGPDPRDVTPEPFLPDSEDDDPLDEVIETDAALDQEEADAARLDRRLDELKQAAEMRAWYTRNPSFAEWIDLNGGIASERRVR